jgi:hypothetical protein
MGGTHEEHVFEYDLILLIMFSRGILGKGITAAARKKDSHYLIFRNIRLHSRAITQTRTPQVRHHQLARQSNCILN